MDELAAERGRRSRLDLVIAAGVGVLTLVVCLFFAPRGFQAGFVDMGHDGYQLRQVLDLSRGGVIFRDTFDQYGPLNGYLNVAGFLTFGRRLLAVKYFICFWYMLIAAGLYVLSRHWLSPGLAVFSALVWLGLAPFYNHGIMISPHVYTLFFQILATIVVLRTPELAPRRFAVVGLLAGVCWAIKQSMGVFFLAAILAYLGLRWAIGHAAPRRVMGAAFAMSIAFTAVVGIGLGLLWWHGALGDWYLQTIVFPRDFYLVSSAPVDGAGNARVLSRLIDPLTAFVSLQLAEPLYWIVIRAVVVLTALAQVARRRPVDDLLLISSITIFLWLGAYPSANFMHQWWTASLTIAPFIACVWQPLTRWARSKRTAMRATVAVVSIIVGPGVIARVDATVSRAETLTETLTDPPMFRGIRTDVATKRAFEMLYQSMSHYRAGHPGTKVVSIESSDGWSNGMVESLPLLSFLDENPHAQPVYWSLPVLSTTVYPAYGAVLWREVSEEHPLIVEHRQGTYKPLGIAGYGLLAAAQSDDGHWYVYAPDDAELEGFPTYLARYGSTEVEGAWRGRVSAPPRNGAVELPGDSPLTLLEPAAPASPEPVNLYTWPAGLREAKVDRPVEPVSTDVFWRGGRWDIVRDFKPGAWTVDGEAQGPFAYLLQWSDELLTRGTYFVMRGELFEGGVEVGLLNQGQWSGTVVVTRPGPFEVIIETQNTDRYALVVANCVSSWWQRAQSDPLNGVRDLLRGRFLPNRFRVTQAGWIASPPPLAFANAHDIPQGVQHVVGGLK